MVLLVCTVSVGLKLEKIKFGALMKMGIMD